MYQIDESKIPDNIHVQAGDFVESVVLPDTVRKIGKNVFFNCKRLQQINICGDIEEIGADIFMNCINLSRIVLRGQIKCKTCLKQILSQISWNVEVIFDDPKEQALIFYPEYFEGYDEIGPAHIYELNISGEGFRTRQCFDKGIFRFDEYDSIFPQACAEEPVTNLINMALNRIAYPFELDYEKQNVYVMFLKEHSDDIIKFVFGAEIEKERQLKYISSLAKLGCVTAQDMGKMIEKASENGQVELSVRLLKLKNDYFSIDTKTTKKYSFEDF